MNGRLSTLVEELRSRKRANQTLIPPEWDSELRSVGGGFLITLFLHFLLIWAVPWQLAPTAATGKRWTQNVEYVYDEPESEDKRYVEANQEAPDNPPDETPNFSNRDQQAGQVADSAASDSRLPYLEGEEVKSPKIIDGEYDQPTAPPSPARDRSEERNQEADAVRFLPKTQPLRTHVLEQEAVGVEGLASMLDDPSKMVEEVEGAEDIEQEQLEIPLTLDVFQVVHVAPETVETETAADPAPPSDVQLPRPRPRLTMKSLPGPIMRSNGRAPVIGAIQVDAKFHDFGDYLARMFESISQQFQLNSSQSEAVDGEIASRVEVEYFLRSDGDVFGVTVKHTTAGSVATLICKDAIQSTAPFGNWTLEMLETLDPVEPIEITFLFR